MVEVLLKLNVKAVSDDNNDGSGRDSEDKDNDKGRGGNNEGTWYNKVKGGQLCWWW